tara:strand:+ start:133 stop:282 length:150 start_codon:yes stop_codon:yes gene_type:complete
LHIIKNANALINTFSLKEKNQKKIEKLEIEEIEKLKNEEKKLEEFSPTH